MEPMSPPQLALDGSRLRLNTMIRLRWLAVAGQLTTILAIYYGFGFPLPLVASISIIALSAFLNSILSLSNPRSKRLVSRHAMQLLSYDILQLSALLYLTGGLENPFAFLMVVPVAVSASTQPLAITSGLAGLAIACASVLAKWHLPLPWAHDNPPLLPLNYLIGVWAALVSCIVFIAIYAWRIGQEARQMSQALTAAELVLAREQRLTALDGLAAAAAHQLGTPLSTIALVAKELEREVPKDSPLRDDILLLQTQAVRCREILSQLSWSGQEGEADHIFSQMRLSHILEEVVAPLRTPGIEIDVKIVDCAPQTRPAAEPVVPRNPGLIHGLGNLVENALDFANDRVSIIASFDNSIVRLQISDDGPGFAPNVLTHLGEPYVSRRTRGSVRDDESGLGLGFFIAKTLLERSGGAIRASNKALPDSGAIVEVSWQRERLENAT